MMPPIVWALIIGTIAALALAGWLLVRSRRADAERIDIVAQAIARCYGHGPLARMDPAYQDEFRRDARAAISAMRRRT